MCDDSISLKVLALLIERIKGASERCIGGSQGH